MKIVAVPALVILFASLATAQNYAASPTMYAESFRKGPTRTTEEEPYEIKVTSDNPIYKQRVRDTTGTERYELTVYPVIGENEGNNKITAWQVSLRDLRHPVYGNVLQFDKELSENPRDNLYWLNPVRSAAVPIYAKRIIKVEGFYISFQVKGYHFSPPDSPYLDAMTLQMQLTNNDPKKAEKQQ
jgi:hypothetical protein